MYMEIVHYSVNRWLLSIYAFVCVITDYFTVRLAYTHAVNTRLSPPLRELGHKTILIAKISGCLFEQEVNSCIPTSASGGTGVCHVNSSMYIQ